MPAEQTGATTVTVTTTILAATAYGITAEQLVFGALCWVAGQTFRSMSYLSACFENGTRPNYAKALAPWALSIPAGATASLAAFLTARLLKIDTGYDPAILIALFVFAAKGPDGVSMFMDWISRGVPKQPDQGAKP